MSEITVGVGDCRISNKPDETIVTFALGSCIAVVIHDPVAHVGGMLHFMLPACDGTPGTRLEQPFLYADKGIPLLFQNAYRLGAEKKRLQVSIFGGAQVMDPEGAFNIGQRNQEATRSIFRRAGVKVQTEEVGGMLSRTVRLHVQSGCIQLTHGETRRVIEPRH